MIIPDDAQPAEKRAAAELEIHLERITGRDFRIIRESKFTPSGPAIFVGRTQLARELDIAPPQTNSPWDDSFRLKTHGENLFIVGANSRGTLFGAYETLEKLGVRWFTAQIARMPRTADPTLPKMDEYHRPAFISRDIFIQEAFNPAWASRLRLNGQGASPETSFGGHVSFGRFVHTLGEIVPGGLAAEHPEYFPEVGGFRVVTDAGKIQRELTHPGVLRLARSKLREWALAHPDADIFSVSQNDGHGWSQSAEARKLLDLHGGNSGVLLWFINQLADDFAREHPGKFIETLAYMRSEKPPVGISPRENVIVRLCAYWCKQGLPYEESPDPMTQDFARHLRGWARVAPHLWVWHYGTDFAHYLMPFPDFAQFPRNLRLYQSVGVKGVFFQGSYQSPGGNWAELRAYVVGKLLWNPGADADALIDEWMRGVYGRGWRQMRAWFDLIHAEAVRTEGLFGIYAPVRQPFLDGKILAQSQSLLRRARRLSRNDRIALAQIDKAALWLDYTLVAQGAKNAPSRAALAQKLKAHGVTHISEWQTLDEWAARE
ncbi:DUF4838 domain-containing protein [Oscillatoria laete-virens NRMC-F 0139]|nr:DUF4838 domain-containing protein [Oscillatoria laete-virens]MDL5053179.1 DUF4838 domain-containing protein [Oscillatoria laete-virens NRMC-F 0139]